MFAFTKDFKFGLNKTAVNIIYQKVSVAGKELEMHQFLASLKLLASKSIEAKTIETKHRLAELKQVLTYPENKAPIVESIEKILNDLPAEKPLPRKFLKGKKGVKQLLDGDELQNE